MNIHRNLPNLIIQKNNTMTHQEQLTIDINRIKKENPKHKVVVFINPIDFGTLEGLDKLPCQVVKTNNVKMGGIEMRLIPKSFIRAAKRKQAFKSFFKKILSWVKRNLFFMEK